MKFNAEREFMTDKVALYLTDEGREQFSVAKPAVFETLDDYQIAAQRHEPLVRLSNTEAQRLMDQLWHVGLRPSEGTGSAGAMAATQKHLEDMRTLVFQRVGKGA